jgi:hypothetical protein
MKLKVGDKLETQCIACDEDEIWEVESITKEEYLDGLFKTYNLNAIKNCLFPGAKKSVKNVPECMKFYKKI